MFPLQYAQDCGTKPEAPRFWPFTLIFVETLKSCFKLLLVLLEPTSSHDGDSILSIPFE